MDPDGSGSSDEADNLINAPQKDRNELNFVRNINFHLHLLRREEKIDRQMREKGLIPPKHLELL